MMDEIEELHMDIVGIQETKWPGEGELKSQDGKHTLIYSGRNDNVRRQGVGLALSENAYANLLEFEHMSERMCRARIKCEFYNLSVVCAYAPTNDAEEDEKDDFYEALEECYSNLPGHDMKIVIGDLNAKVGREKALFGDSIGVDSLHATSNENGIRLGSFAVATQMVIGGTIFKHKDIHKGTWKSPDGQTTNQIDHILVDMRHRTGLQDVRVKRGATCDTDHFLVAGNLKGKLTTKKKGKAEATTRYAVEKLEDMEVREAYAVEVANRFSVLEPTNEDTADEEEDVDLNWERIKKAVQGAAEEALGKTRRRVKEYWFNEECSRAVQGRKAKREAWLRDETSREKFEEKMTADREARRVLQREKRNELKKKLREMELAHSQGQMRNFFREVNSNRKGYQPRMGRMVNEEGKMVTEEVDVLEYGRVHFRERLNRPEPAEPLEEMARQTVELEIDPPSRREVMAVIRKLKNFKSPGSDGITSEMLKAGGRELAERIHSLIECIWKSRKMPEEWDEAILVPLFKKGRKDTFQNYRGISLLQTTYKVFTLCLYRKLKMYTDEIIGPYQAGFMQGKSTTDQIFSVRQILERRWEYNQESVHLFVDYLQAYDSVHRPGLWAILEDFGVPRHLVDLLKACYRNPTAKVKVEAKLSKAFEINSGLRQGCALSPILFNVVMEKIYRAVKDRNEGLVVNGKKINMLAFADDVDLTTEKEEELTTLLPAMIVAGASVGLKINEEKTKLMVVTKRQNANTGHMRVGDNTFERVKHFKYLGVNLNDKNIVEVEILTRLQLANKAYFGSLNMLKSRNLSRATKLLIYKVCIRPVLTYGCETWVLTKKTEQRLRVFERKILRKITGPVCDQQTGEWRRRYNQELRDITKQEDIVVFIQTLRLKWAGHVARMPNEAIAKEALSAPGRGRRRPGRPRTRWKDNITKDSGRNDWEAAAQDRAFWRDAVQEAKVQLELRAVE
jgi:hypothetical protein